MKLNNKGTSLMELIISIALISVVLVFMMKLLVDINNAETNNDFAKDNQINRAEIIRFIENDLYNKTITKIDDFGSNESELVINFTIADSNPAKLSATKDTLTYKNSNGETRKWSMKDCEIKVDKANVYYNKPNYSDDALLNAETVFSMVIDIEIHTNNENNTDASIEKKDGVTDDNLVNNKIVSFNNNLDDIIISYIGKNAENIVPNTSCLGNGC